MRMSWHDTKFGCDRLQVSDVPKDPERGTEAKEVLGFRHDLLDFRSHAHCSSNDG